MGIGFVVNKGDGSDYKYVNIVNALGNPEVVLRKGSSAIGSSDNPIYANVDGEATPCGFRIFYKNIASADGTYKFSYSSICLIFMQRSSDRKIVSLDNWSAVTNIVNENLDDISVSCTNKTVSVSSNRISSVSMLIIAN